MVTTVILLRGPKKAAIAVAASLLTAAYHMLKNGTFHQDIGADFLVKRDKARIATKLANRIKDLGYDVSFTPCRLSSRRAFISG